MPRTFKAFRVHAHEPAHSPAQLTLHAFAAIRIARNAIAAATFRALPFKDDSHE